MHSICVLFHLLRLAYVRHFGQGEEHDLFACDGADVVVHTHNCDACNFQDHCLDERSRGFDKMGTHLFKEAPSLVGGQRLDQVLFGRGQVALEADKENFVDQMRADVLRTRPMYSCANRPIPSQMAASISPCVLMVTSKAFHRPFANRGLVLLKSAARLGSSEVVLPGDHYSNGKYIFVAFDTWRGIIADAGKLYCVKGRSYKQLM
jgi:hypothetical protein